MGHEDLQREEDIKTSSDKTFGLVFAGVFLLIAVWPLFRGGEPRLWALLPAAVFTLFALVRPSLLAVPNRLWTRFGLLLGKVISPIMLGLLFFAVLVPIGALMRIFGQDPLRLKRDTAAGSYWIPRQPPGPPPGSLTNQF